MRFAGVTLALVLLAGCGSGATRPSGAAGRTPATASAAPTNTPPGGSNVPHSSPGATTAPARTGASPAPAPLGTSTGGRVVLGATCVHRGDGSEQQSLTVAAGPGETVTYSTYYSDYSTELNRPDYTTGHGYGSAGSDGRFRASWTVPAAATPGRATVRVTATDMPGDAQEASFFVAKQGDRCP